jgi:predicted small secreted protein
MKRVAIVLAAGLLTACETTGERVRGANDTVEETVAVRFVVKGQGRAQVTYGTINSTSQDTVRLPWSETAQLDETFDVATLLAQRQGGGPGIIRCLIENEAGAVLEQARGSGPYAICNVSTG